MGAVGGLVGLLGALGGVLVPLGAAPLQAATGDPRMLFGVLLGLTLVSAVWFAAASVGQASRATEPLGESEPPRENAAGPVGAAAPGVAVAGRRSA